MAFNTYHRLENGNLHSMPDVEVVIESFGYRHCSAPEADITLDLRRLLRNPHDDLAMRDLTGLRRDVYDHVMATPGALPLVQNTAGAVLGLVVTVGRPGMRMVRLAVGCAGGRHRSVAVAEAVGAVLMALEVGVDIVHRDLHRPVLTSA